jgi:four helix bundle protein
MGNSIIRDKSYKFATATVSLYKKLNKKREFVFARQLVKSATSIGANVEEALAAQSRKDFISKMSIASKEARETKYWLRIINDCHLVDDDLTDYLIQIDEIIKILTSIVKSSLENDK